MEFKTRNKLITYFKNYSINNWHQNNTKSNNIRENIENQFSTIIPAYRNGE